MRDVSFRLPGGRLLFEGVDLDVEAGRFVAITGPSGVGKSTLLAILGGLIAPTSGTISHGLGEPSSIAWIPQGLNVLPARNVLDNCTLLSRADGITRRDAERVARRWLGDLGLAPLERTRARKLSGGELQRLTIARALCSGRPLLLVDEPTSQLDRHNASTAMESLERHARDGHAVVVVTHDHASLPVGAEVLALGPTGLDAP